MDQGGLGRLAYVVRAMIDSGLLGLCDSDDHAYDVMVIIAGYYELYHRNG